MIYDCFPFFNELDILEIRLNELDSVVDRFVISESTVTFTGEKKPLYYEENKERFQSFQHKIIHNIVTDTPDVSPFERDVFQKNAIKRGLADCQDSDIIVFSDLDEIPNAETLKEAIQTFQADKVYHFAQRQFYFYLNLEEISGNLLSYSGEFEGVKNRKWLGSKMASYSLIKDMDLGELRAPSMKENGIRLSNGGWHFTYMGGDKEMGVEGRVIHKIKSAAHQELNTPSILSNVSKKISKNKDVFGRKSKFKRIDFDETFPKYLIDKIECFEHLVLKKQNRKSWLSWFKK